MWTLTELLVVGAVGFLLLGRRDFPMFSRMAGRVAGSGVRAVRRARKGLEEAVREGEQTGDLKKVEDLRQDVTESVQKVRSFGQALKDEFRPLDLAGSKPSLSKDARIHQAYPGKGSRGEEAGSRSVSQTPPDTSASGGGGTVKSQPEARTVGRLANDSDSGVDVICSTIEEDAFSRKQSDSAGLKDALPKKSER